jgi:hypothetical protein
MSIPTGTILRVVANMGYTDGEINQNVYNCVISGGGGPFDEFDVLDDCEDWLDDMYLNIVALVSSSLDGLSTIVYKYDTVGDDWDEVGTNAFTWNPTGGVNDGLPRGVAGLVTAKSTDPDTDARKYIPGLVEATLTSALFDAGTVIALLALGADWVTPFVGAASGADFTPVVWSVVGKVAKDLIDTVIVPTIPAYQRRRKNNVGI